MSKEIIDYEDDTEVYQKNEKSTNKFIKKKREQRDYSWNNDISNALKAAGLKVKSKKEGKQ